MTYNSTNVKLKDGLNEAIKKGIVDVQESHEDMDPSTREINLGLIADEELERQINSIIRDEIQDVINDYVDAKENTKKAGIGFVENEDKLKVNISKGEVDKLIKQYKKLKKQEKSNLSQVKKLGLVDKNGNPLK